MHQELNRGRLGQNGPCVSGVAHQCSWAPGHVPHQGTPGHICPLPHRKEFDGVGETLRDRWPTRPRSTHGRPRQTASHVAPAHRARGEVRVHHFARGLRGSDPKNVQPRGLLLAIRVGVATDDGQDARGQVGRSFQTGRRWQARGPWAPRAGHCSHHARGVPGVDTWGSGVLGRLQCAHWNIVPHAAALDHSGVQVYDNSQPGVSRPHSRVPDQAYTGACGRHRGRGAPRH